VALEIVVCVKQVPDPECGRDSLAISGDSLRVEPRGLSPVLSPFDENALEAALRIKDASASDAVRVTVLSVGKKIARVVVETALAAGADAFVKVEDERFGADQLDSFATASVLAAAMAKLGRCDLLLAGRQAADWNAGQVGVGVAHLRKVPVVTFARRVDVDAGTVIVERLTCDGYERVRAALPAVVTVSNEVGALRYPSIAQRKAARSKPVVAWNAADIGCDTPPPRRLRLVGLSSPASRETQCVLVEGADGADAGRKLAERLHRDGVL
jgi:electron transfer flavoprotein beta subunit